MSSSPIMDENTQQPSVLGTRSLQDLQMAKECRASEALKIKDQQVRMLTEQNIKLLSSLDRTEEELRTFQLEKLTIEEENRNLRQSNFDLQAKTKSAEGQLIELRSAYEDQESQLSTMTAKNTELFELLGAEEANISRLKQEFEQCKVESTGLSEKYVGLVHSSKEAEDTAKRLSRDNSLKADEIRVLRLEVEQLKQKNSELSIKSTVELDTAHEQLRVRKEKQYQLLGKLQSQEEYIRQAEDQSKEFEKSIRELQQKSSELQAALQLETNARMSQDNSNRTMSIDFQTVSAENKELSSRLTGMEQERLKLEAEVRDNGEQLREMAEKVFQLLERLKLAELGKKKSTEALAKKEQEIFAVKKALKKMAEDVLDMKKIREKLDAEKRILEDQLRGLKKMNTQLAQKLKEETKVRLREEEACKDANEKVQTLDGRLAFILKRLQTDEENKLIQQDDLEKKETQVQIMVQKCEALQNKLSIAEENNRDLSNKVHQAEKELKDAKIKLDSMEQTRQLEEENAFQSERKAIQTKETGDRHLAGGQLRFFVDNRPSLGYLVISGKSPKDKAWIEENGCNAFLRKISKSQNATEAFAKKIAELYGVIVLGEEKVEKAINDLKSRNNDLEKLDRELDKMQTFIYSEEESKRRILLRYVRAVKASVSLGEPGCEEDRKEVGRVGAGRICLPDSSLGDEEVHVIVAMLRNNRTIEELQLRSNYISDDGARAIAAVLAEPSAIKSIDLRENNIGMMGIKAIAEALERSERVHKVFVHPGGKIEALGATEDVTASETIALAVTTACVVDVRDNRQKTAGEKFIVSNRLRGLQRERPAEEKAGHSNKTHSSDERPSMSQSPSTKRRQRKKKSNMILRPRPSSVGSRRGRH
ncbi:hypothetical protein HJC23_002884 [Cyclotella cryptica]|uniref:Uncharacterized protein n=1 Tax=Cyclotella cryptica TaxID=29204 RepID=A0ABD3NSE8_9STRA